MNSNGDVVVESNQFPISSMDTIRALKKQELLHERSIPYCGYFTNSNMHTNAIRYGHGHVHSHQNQQRTYNRSRHSHHNFSRKKSPCILFTSRGYCTYGNNCKFLHEDGQDGPPGINSFTLDTPVLEEYVLFMICFKNYYYTYLTHCCIVNYSLLFITRRIKINRK
jgi:hypothetical protein